MTRVFLLGPDAPALIAGLSGDAPEVEFRHAPSVTPEALALARDCEVLIGFAPAITPALVAAMPGLRWIHALTTGVDNLLAMNLPAHVALSRSGGFHGPQMSELAVLLMLALGRRFPAMLANQQAARWERWPQPLLQGRTACLVGLGAIAETLIPLLGAFGMTVTGVSDGRSAHPLLAGVYPRARLAEAAAGADFMIVIVPYAPETHHLIDARVLAAMKPSAFVVNISRGGCVDEAALLAALDAGRIAGAGLDVFATEPLPADSRFWAHPKVIVTPHIGGMADVYAAQVLPVVARNLAAWQAGAALPDLVERPDAPA